MADVLDDGGSVADQIDDSEETSPDELNAVARENVQRVERNRRRAERRADVADLAAISDDESLIGTPSRTTSPAPSTPETGPSSVDSSPSLAMHPACKTLISYAQFAYTYTTNHFLPLHPHAASLRAQRLMFFGRICSPWSLLSNVYQVTCLAPNSVVWYY